MDCLQLVEGVQKEQQHVANLSELGNVRKPQLPGPQKREALVGWPRVEGCIEAHGKPIRLRDSDLVESNVRPGDVQCHA